jgi:hypothetical protein
MLLGRSHVFVKPLGFLFFSLQQVTISERFELESSDWAHFLRLFELKLKINQRR